MTDLLTLSSLPEYLRDAIQNNVRAVCPKCDGGRSREQSLSIRQDDRVVSMKCYRASCGWYALAAMESGARVVSKPIKKVTVYRDETKPLGKYLCSQLASYGLDISTWHTHGWRTDVRTERTLVMPVRDPYGGERGVVTRTFDEPKRCYTFRATAQPWLDWWPSIMREDTIIVEDCLSACRLAGTGYSSVALLGTGITVEQAKEIDFHSAGRIYLALDNDAFAKSLKLVKRHAHILQMQPILLQQDIKNMELDSDIRALFT